jgi:DNA helicase-2/ATP-dependent DNA helicase PcrA
MPAVSEKPAISTFHSFAVRLLRQYAGRLGFDKGFTILDSSEHLALIREAAVSALVDVQKFKPPLLAERVGRVKELLDDEGFAARASSHLDRSVAKILPIYRELQRARGALDFEDLVAEAVKLLEAHSDVRSALLGRIRFVMIDEYQDTNHAQYRLANLLAGERENLCVVGDPDQSIYGWRGADMKNILQFEEDYPRAKVVLLERNYRSTATILRASNHLIGHNAIRKDKQLLPTGEEGRPIDVLPCADAEMEADAVARRIKRFIDRDGVRPNEIAIAYRGKVHAPRYEEALLRHGVPASVVGSISFFDRREVKDTLSFVRLAVNPKDDLAALRALRVQTKGVGKKTLEKLHELQRTRGLSIVEACKRASEVPSFTAKRRAVLERFAETVERLQAAAQGAVEDVVAAAIAEVFVEEDEGDDTRSGNLRKLTEVARKADKRAGGGGRGGGRTRDFLDRLSLIDAQDKKDDDGTERVVLTTIHASKGLEFDVVFVVGLEDGLFPHHRSVEEGHLEEERRLAYVAFTRARKRLILTYANNRTSRISKASKRRPSIFLYELPSELLWDPQLREPMILPDRDGGDEEPTPEPRAKLHSKPKKGKLIGVAPARGEAAVPLWKRGLISARR